MVGNLLEREPRRR